MQQSGLAYRGLKKFQIRKKEVNKKHTNFLIKWIYCMLPVLMYHQLLSDLMPIKASQLFTASL